MRGTEQAAVLLMSMGEDLAASVMRHMAPREIEKLGSAMAELHEVSQSQVGDVVGKFCHEIGDATALGVGSRSYVKGVLTQAFGNDKARGMLERIFRGDDESGLDMLRWMEPTAIAEAVAHEHPQVIAIVLRHLEPDQAGIVLGSLPKEIGRDALIRVANLNSVPGHALKELGSVLEGAMAARRTGNTGPLGGAKVAADLVNALVGTAGSELLELVREQDAGLAAGIEEMMFVFEDLLDVDGRGIQTLLRGVQSETLLVALKGATQEMRDLIYDNMSKRAADLLREDLEARGPIRLSEVEAAQKEILEVARKLIESGEIAYGAGGEGFV